MKKVCWNITSKCNRNCKYCFKFDKEDLTLKQNMTILDKLIEMNVAEIDWCGGEPFLFKQLNTLLKKAKESGIVNNVITNATLLNKNNIEQKMEFIDKLSISLDFIDDSLNEKYGIGKDYYKHVKEVIKTIKKIKPNIEIQINSVLFKGNFKHLDELYKELLNLEIDSWKIISFTPIRGRALKEKDNLYIDDEKFKETTDKYFHTSQKFKIVIHSSKEMNLRHHIVLSSGKFVNSENGKDKVIFEKLL